MLRIALRDTRASLLKLGMSIVAVLLGVSFVVGTFSLREVMSSTFTSIVDSSYSAAAYVQPTGDTGNVVEGNVGDSTIPLTIVEQLSSIDGVGAVVPNVGGPAILVKKDGTALAGTNGPPTLAFSVDENDPTLRLTDGRNPANGAEIALETATAERADLAIGDSTRVIINGDIHEVTVVGLAHFDGATAGASLILVDAATARETFAPEGKVPSIAIFASDQLSGAGTPDELSQDDEKAFVKDVSAQMTALGIDSADYTVESGTSIRDEANADTNEALGFITTFLLIFAAIALFVGGFVIANTFTMTVRQKQREYAMLRAVGASPAQVFSVVVVQAALVGLIGGALGVAGGFGLVQLIRSLFESFGMEMSTELALTTPIIVLGLTVGVVVAVVSAALAARKAALTAPVEAMRDTAAPATSVGLFRKILGFLMFAAGTALMVFAVVEVRADEDAAVGSLFGIGAALALVGMLAIAPVLAKPVVSFLSAPLRVLARPMGRLAHGNIQRNPKRTSATAGALMVGMALVGAAAVLASSVTVAMQSIVAKEFSADFVVQSATFNISQQVYDEIEQLDEVSVVSSFAAANVDVTPLKKTATGSEQPSDSTLLIGATENSTLGTTWKTEPIEGDLDTLAQGQAIVQKGTAEDNGWKLGDTITLSGLEGTQELRIGAIIDSVALGVQVLISDDVLDKVEPQSGQQIVNIMVNAADGTTSEQLRAALTDIAKPYLILSIYDQDEFTSELTKQVDQMLIILYALLALSLVIAVLGIVNTLALSVIERTREIGLMRAVGLGKLQLSTTFVFESILTALFGTILGLAVGVGIASGLPSILKSQGFTSLSIPWSALSVMLVLAVIVGVFAALWPAWRASRLPVLEAIAAVE
ncbi:ABC transporter permease [Timonella sp. A28]|uniref:ABC transporter permease n=1 Tax=Timonella sp. A28 TaxID=3442640 RepID=UPI003EBB5853